MPIGKYYKGHGEEVMADMKKEYGAEKGERVFYATKNARDHGKDHGKDAKKAKPRGKKHAPPQAPESSGAPFGGISRRMTTPTREAPDIHARRAASRERYIKSR